MTTPLSVELSDFARTAAISSDAQERARIMVADTLIAILSGRHLPAGPAVRLYANSADSVEKGGARELGSGSSLAMGDAAFVNGTLAHANETDDSHEGARMHPACSIVPAALSSAEALQASVGEMLDAVAIGYDIGVALNLGTWPDPRVLRASRSSTHHIGGLFGSLGARLRVGKVETEVGSTAFSYAVQHAGGCTTWLRDTEHVEKGVVFGGLPARSALFSCELAQLGFSGVQDPFAGPESYFDAFGVDSDASITRERLKSPGLAVQETCVKRYPVGMPIMAAVQAVEQMVGYGQTAAPTSVHVELPQEKVHVVDNREMDDISLQHILALQLLSGEVDFAVLHELAELPSGVLELRDRITLVGTTDLDAENNGFDTTRVARVTLDFDGNKQEELVAWPVGTPKNPIGWDGMERKSREVLGSVGWDVEAAAQLMRTVQNFDTAAPSAQLVDEVMKLAKN